MDAHGVIYGGSSPNRFKFVAEGTVQVGDYVEVDAPAAAAGDDEPARPILAQVDDVTYRSNLPADSALALEAPDPGPLQAEARVLGSPTNRGVGAPRAPFPPGARVRPARPETVRDGLGLGDEGCYVGHLRDTTLPVKLGVDTLVQKQVAILAKTGAGKSYVVGVLVEELAKAGVPVVIVDPHGEHTSLRHPNLEANDHRAMARFGVKPRGYNGRVVEFTPSPDVNPEGRPLKLDGRDLSAEEICSLARLTGYAANLVHAVVQELRAEAWDDDDGGSGDGDDDGPAGGDGDDDRDDDRDGVDDPEGPHGPWDPDGAGDPRPDDEALLDEPLAATVGMGGSGNGDGNGNGRGHGTAARNGTVTAADDGTAAGDGKARAEVAPDEPGMAGPGSPAGYTLRDLRRRVLSKENGSWQVVTALEYLENLGLFADPAKGERPVRAEDLVRPGQVTVVNLRGTPPDIQEAVVARLATTLFEARKRREVPPLMLVLEEAHAFCPERNLGSAISQQAVRTVASEGRKFGLGLTVVTQRPAKVDKNVLSQANSQIVLRVTNANDLKAISASMEGSTPKMEDDIQRLPTGTALVAFPGLLQPVFVDVRPRETRHGGAGVSVLETLERDRGPW